MSRELHVHRPIPPTDSCRPPGDAHTPLYALLDLRDAKIYSTPNVDLVVLLATCKWHNIICSSGTDRIFFIADVELGISAPKRYTVAQFPRGARICKKQRKARLAVDVVP